MGSKKGQAGYTSGAGRLRSMGWGPERPVLSKLTAGSGAVAEGLYQERPLMPLVTELNSVNEQKQ